MTNPTFNHVIRIMDEYSLQRVRTGGNNMKTDIELVQLVLDGEISAYNEIIFRYETPIYKFVSNMIRNDDAGKDICQEVFITAYYKLFSYKKNYKLSNWLFQIAVNKSIDYMRKNKMHQYIDINNTDISDKTMSPEEFVEYKETKIKLEDFIKTLNKTEQQILILRYSNEELTFNDIAEILNMNDSTVKYKYYKIYDKYKKYIDNRKGDVSFYEV